MESVEWKHCGTSLSARYVLRVAETQPWCMEMLLGGEAALPGIAGAEGLARLILAWTLPFAAIAWLSSLPLIHYFPREHLF